jgi:hypothetical protein
VGKKGGERRGGGERERERETAEVQYTTAPMLAKKFFAPMLE